MRKKRPPRTADPIPGKKRYKWTVRFEVDAVWVADGFDLTDERALEMLARDLNYANVDLELRAKVLKAPKPNDILWEQGYKVDEEVTLEVTK